MNKLPLLATKLYIPEPRPDQVARPELLARLGAGLQDASGRFLRKLTLVSAPAGFGKTTLLSAWAARDEFQTAWISLDEGDNDPTRFWSYIISSLCKLREEINLAALAALNSGKQVQIDLLLTGLLNEFVAHERDGRESAVILILDDFHLIATTEIHEGLLFLLENLPPTLHLIISSRADPPWPLARLRARGELNELRVKDLRFTLEEVATFLNEVMGLSLSPKDVATLDARTEGWAAGLQMAALAIRGLSGSPSYDTNGELDRHHTSDYIKKFSGSHRFILDFLVEEVLEQQPDHVQEFLLWTSILNRLTAPLCDVITNRDDSHEILARLNKENLFLIQLDDERHWYRYHHLFSDLLRQRLQQLNPLIIPQLHCRASRWFEEEGAVADAVVHALAANDIPQVARLAEDNVLAMMERGELSALTGWLKALPDDIIHSWPWLCTACSWALAHAGRFEETLLCLDTLTQILVEKGYPSSVKQITGHINAIRLYVAAMTFLDWEKAETYARDSMTLLPQSDARTRGLVAVLHGFVRRTNHDYDAARSGLVEALKASKLAGEQYAIVDLLCQLARVEAQQGNLHQAAATCQQAIHEAQSGQAAGSYTLPVVGYAHNTLGSILLEWNELTTALYHAEIAAKLSQQWGQFDSWIESQELLALIHHKNGHAAAALDFIHQASQAIDIAPTYLARQEVLIRLESGDLSFAIEWAKEQNLAFNTEYIGYKLTQNLLLARIRICQFKDGSWPSLEDVLTHLERLFTRLQALNATRNCIKILVLQTIGWHASGQVDRALETLARALVLAEPQGYVWTFTRYGEDMARLLRLAVAQGIAVSYAAHLLDVLEIKGANLSELEPAVPSSLVDSLSDRELQVLRLLTTSLTSAEIAEQLIVAPSTVRSHIKNIYSKFQVHSRIEATQRARELRLL